MCGRVVLSSAPHQLAERFFLDMVPELLPRFNIAPGQEISVVVPNPNTEGRLIQTLQWGLELPWAKGPQTGSQAHQRPQRIGPGKARLPRGLSPASLPGSGRWILRMAESPRWEASHSTSGPRIRPDLALAAIWSRQRVSPEAMWSDTAVRS